MNLGRLLAPRARAAMAVIVLSLSARAQQPPPQRRPPAGQQPSPRRQQQAPPQAAQEPQPLVVPALPAPLQAVQRRVVSLREAMQLTAQQSPDVAVARAQAAFTAVGVERAWTYWKPNITATGTYDHTNATSTIPAGFLGPGTPAVVIAAPNTRTGQLQVTQPLLTPYGLFQPGVANAAADAANKNFFNTREQVLLQTAQTYSNLQGLEGLLAAARDAERVALRNEQDARARIEAGTDVEIALLRAQANTANARAQIATYYGQRESLLPLLTALTGEEIAPEPLSASTPSPLGDPADPSTEPWERTYSVQSAISTVVSFNRAVQLDNFLWLPSVTASARGSYSSTLGFSEKHTWYDLLLNVNVPLYDQGVRYAQLHADRASLQQAMANLASARARGRATWEGARATLYALTATLQQANAQAALATRTQEQVQAQYRAGVVTSLDVSTADNNKFQADSAAAQARANVEFQRAQVAAAEGRLYSDVAR